MAAKLSSINLINYIVFNSKFGPKEGQEEQRILFYYPPDVGLDTKIRNVGLCEGIIKFTSTFTDSPTDAVHTHKSRQVFHQPETDFWMTMTVSVPLVEKTVKGKSIKDYETEAVQDSVYQALLIHTYQAFRLFNGSMKYILEKTGKEGLINRLEHFFTKYLTTLPVGSVGVLETFNGVRYLPLNKHSYSRVQSFINQLKSALPQISYTVLLHSDQQIWSDLDPEDSRIMYNYLSTSLLPAATAQELQMSNIPADGRFVVGPASTTDETSVGRIPKVHITDEEREIQCFLLIYRVKSTTLCVLVDGQYQMNFDFLRKLGKYCAQQLSYTTEDIEHGPRKSGLAENQPKYIYFNHMNMAVKETLSVNGRVPTDSEATDSAVKYIGHIYDNFRHSVSETNDGEVIAKLSGDCWVIGKKSDDREVFIIVNGKSSTQLIEVNEEVKRICMANFSNIFFQD